MIIAENIEKKLNDLLGKKAPIQLSEKGRRAIVEYLPWISLGLGFITLLTAYSLWHWAHLVPLTADYINSLSSSYGKAQAPHLTGFVWLGVATLLAEAILLLLAYNGLKRRQKQGWDRLYNAVILNGLYGIFIVLTDYGTVDHVVTVLLTCTISLYFLFQVRSYYDGRRNVKQ